MLETMLVLEAAPGRREELVRYFRQRQVVEAAVPFGLLRGELRARALHGLIVASRWHDEAAYQSWLDSQTRAELVQQMGELLDPTVPPRSRAWQSEAIDERYWPVAQTMSSELATSYLLTTVLAP